MAANSRADQLKGKYISLTGQKVLTAKEAAFFETVAHCLTTIDIELRELKRTVAKLDKGTHQE